MERETFVAQIALHAATLAGVAAALVGLADAEDAAQEALLRAWHAWPSLRDPGAVRAWLLAITVNVCRNWEAGRFGTYRRRTEPLASGNAPTSATFATPSIAGPDAPEHAAALDLRGAVTRLPSDLRLIVALRFYVGMDSSEIGEVLDTPAATVRTRLRRALALLRDELDDADTPSSPGRQRGKGITNG